MKVRFLAFERFQKDVAYLTQKSYENTKIQESKWKILTSQEHSWQRVHNPPYFMKDPLYCLPLKFYPTPSPALFVALFLWLNEWSRHIWCIILYYGSTNVQPWYLSTTRNLWCVLCYKTPVYWGLTHNMVFSSTLIWYHTNKHTQHTQGPIDWNTHINIYINTTCHVLTVAICITLNQ